MARRLTVHVHAVERLEDGGYGRSGSFGPDDVVPDWARAVITNPDVWDGDDEATPVEPTPVEVKQPPRKGPGSGGTAWVEFAKSKGVTRDFDSKEALIAHLEDEGHIEKG
jgi:hypothetical protein